jgi:hypothetical protein
MLADNYIDLLKQGRIPWNKWRDENYNERLNFHDTFLDDSNFEGYNLNNCHFYKTSLTNCNFNKAEICWSSFLHCNLANSTITNPDLKQFSEMTSFQGVNLRWTAFGKCSMQNVNLQGSLFESVHLHDCDLTGANISHSRIYGVSSWGNEINETTIQNNLIITPAMEPTITVDNFEIAQFLYLLITNKKIRSVIDTLATKVVLILGAFSDDNKEVLNHIKLVLTHQNYIPVIFDFDKPSSRNLTETVSTLAHLSKFVVVDLSNPRSVPHELASIIPTLRSVPIIPIIKYGETPYGMFVDFQDLNHVSPIIEYRTSDLDKLVLEILNHSKS